MRSALRQAQGPTVTQSTGSGTDQNLRGIAVYLFPESALVSKHRLMQSGSTIIHCGIIVDTPSGLQVLEAAGRVRLTSIEDFFGKRIGKAERLTRRVSDRERKVDYKRYLNKRYDNAFSLDNDAYYCSELVYLIYEDQFHRKLCEPRPLRDYHVFGLRWLIRKRGIDLDQLVVTPADLYRALGGSRSGSRSRSGGRSWSDARRRGYNGMDISHHNSIDWNAVKADENLQFCYIKSTEGSTFIDRRYQSHLRRAKEADLKVGLYHYFSSHSSGQAQFEHFDRCLKAHSWDLIPVIDLETPGNDFSDIGRLKTILADFLEAFYREYGYHPVVYFGDANAYKLLPTARGCKFWFRTVGFSRLVPRGLFQQVAVASKYNGQVDLNYCKDLEYILVKG